MEQLQVDVFSSVGSRFRALGIL